MKLSCSGACDLFSSRFAGYNQLSFESTTVHQFFSAQLEPPPPNKKCAICLHDPLFCAPSFRLYSGIPGNTGTLRRAPLYLRRTYISSLHPRPSRPPPPNFFLISCIRCQLPASRSSFYSFHLPVTLRVSIKFLSVGRVHRLPIATRNFEFRRIGENALSQMDGKALTLSSSLASN